MEIIRDEDITTYDLPDKIDYKNVIYWSPETKELKGSIKNKAIKFIKLNLIRERDWGFIVFPIPGYNKTTYSIVENMCNCQGFKKNNDCSHLLAVNLFLKIRNWKK